MVLINKTQKVQYCLKEMSQLFSDKIELLKGQIQNQLKYA